MIISGNASAPTPIIWGRAFKLGVAAERDRIRGLLAQADAIADELVALRTKVHRLEVLASAAPDQALHWSTH